MTNDEKQTLQTVYEQLNGLLFDIENGNGTEYLSDTVTDCINLLAQIGVNNE